jgi:hypothetical protein
MCPYAMEAAPFADRPMTTLSLRLGHVPYACRSVSEADARLKLSRSLTNQEEALRRMFQPRDRRRIPSPGRRRTGCAALR